MQGIRIYLPIWEKFCSNFIFLKFSVWTLKILNWWKKLLKIEWIDKCPGHLHTFEAVFKIGHILFWSLSSKYLTISILELYLFFPFFHNIVRDLLLLIWFKNCMQCVEAVSEYKTRYHWILTKYKQVLWWEKIVLWCNGVKKWDLLSYQILINPSSTSLKYDKYILETYFENLQLLLFKLTDQSYLHIRLKSCHHFQSHSTFSD